MSNKEIKVGDRVRSTKQIVALYASDGVIVEDEVFTVMFSQGQWIKFEELKSKFHKKDFELVEDTPQMVLGKSFFGKKLEVTPETSAMVQEAVFAAGGGWGTGKYRSKEQKPLYLSEKYLFVDELGILAYSSDTDLFTKNLQPEAILDLVKSLSVKEVVTLEQKKLQSLVKEVSDKERELVALRAELDKLQG